MSKVSQSQEETWVGVGRGRDRGCLRREGGLLFGRASEQGLGDLGDLGAFDEFDRLAPPPSDPHLLLPMRSGNLGASGLSKSDPEARSGVRPEPRGLNC